MFTGNLRRRLRDIQRDVQMIPKLSSVISDLHDDSRQMKPESATYANVNSSATGKGKQKAKTGGNGTSGKGAAAGSRGVASEGGCPHCNCPHARTPSASKSPRASCSSEGEIVCQSSTKLRLCNHGNFVWRVSAARTQCNWVMVQKVKHEAGWTWCMRTGDRGSVEVFEAGMAMGRWGMHKKMWADGRGNARRHVNVAEEMVHGLVEGDEKSRLIGVFEGWSVVGVTCFTYSSSRLPPNSQPPAGFPNLGRLVSSHG